MTKYYYLVSSLPYLRWGRELAVTTGFFLGECAKWLTPEDMKILRSADAKCHEGRCEDTAVLKEWKEFDLRLRTKLSEIREAKKQGEEYAAGDLLKIVMEKENPLLREQALAKIKLAFIEAQSTGYYFDINWLVLYFLRMQILERLAAFDKDKGEEIFYHLCEVAYEQAER